MSIKSVKNLSFISVVKLDQYGCPEPQWCNLGHTNYFKVLPVYQEDRFGVAREILRYEYEPYVPEFEELISGQDYDVPF